MKNQLSLVLRSVAVSSVLALTLFGGVPAALGASATYVVDDAGVNCVGSGTLYASIQDAIDDAILNHVKTIKICGGTYQEVLVIAGANGLKLTAGEPNSVFAWPVLAVPIPATTGGPMLSVAGESKGVVIEKMIIDGTGFSAATGTAAGIFIADATVTVQDVTIANIRNTSLSNFEGTGVLITDTLGGPSSVTLRRLYIANYADFGVTARGEVKLSLLESRIDGENGSNVYRDTGVVLEGTDDGPLSGSISSNLIQGNGNKSIQMDDVSKIKITGNTMERGVSISTDCSFAGAAASSNKVSGNTIFDVPVTSAVEILAIITGDTDCSPVANSNLISSNVMAVSARIGTYAVNIIANNPAGGFTPQAKSNKVTGNRLFGFCCVALSFEAADPAVMNGNFVER